MAGKPIADRGTMTRPKSIVWLEWLFIGRWLLMSAVLPCAGPSEFNRRGGLDPNYIYESFCATAWEERRVNGARHINDCKPADHDETIGAGPK